MGSPKVSVELNGFVTDLTDKNSDLLLIYLGGGTRFFLQNPAQSGDKFEIAKAALATVLNVYEKGKGVKKDKDLDHLLDLRKKGELDTWLKEKLVVQK